MSETESPESEVAFRKTAAKNWLIQNRDTMPRDVLQTLLEGIGVKLAVAPIVRSETPGTAAVEKSETVSPKEQRFLDFLEHAKQYIGQDGVDKQMRLLKKAKTKTDFPWDKNENIEIESAAYNTIDNYLPNLTEDQIQKEAFDFFNQYLRKEFGKEILYPKRGTKYNMREFEMAGVESYAPGVQEQEIIRVIMHGYIKTDGTVVRKARVVIRR